jgi:hypothetical protein
MHSVIQNWGPVMVIVFTYLIGLYVQAHLVESLRRELNAKIEGFRGEVNSKIDALRAEMRQAFAELRLEFHSTLSELTHRVEKIEERGGVVRP